MSTCLPIYILPIYMYARLHAFTPTRLHVYMPALHVEHANPNINPDPNKTPNKNPNPNIIPNPNKNPNPTKTLTLTLKKIIILNLILYSFHVY